MFYSIPEKEKLKKFVKNNKAAIYQIYDKNRGYMNYLDISYRDFLIFCYLYS
jgi:hypothetical protein